VKVLSYPPPHRDCKCQDFVTPTLLDDVMYVQLIVQSYSKNLKASSFIKTLNTQMNISHLCAATCSTCFCVLLHMQLNTVNSLTTVHSCIVSISQHHNISQICSNYCYIITREHKRKTGKSKCYKFYQ